jgi:undecaprenyl-diphosphatase
MDGRLFRWINVVADDTTWAHGVVSGIAEYGIVLLAALVLGAFLDARRHDDARGVAGAVWSVAAAIIALGIGQLIGQAVHRARPFVAMPDVHVLIARSRDFSFPSDHATAAAAVAVGLVLTNRRWGMPALVAALTMAAARVYVGVHYPGDVAAGLALGALVAVAGVVALLPLLTRFTEHAARTALRPIVTSAPALQP